MRALSGQGAQGERVGTLALDRAVFCRAFHCHMARPAAEALTAWDFARRAVRRALNRGKAIVIYVEQGRVRIAMEGSDQFSALAESGECIGVYDADCLVRDMAADIAEHFK